MADDRVRHLLAGGRFERQRFPFPIQILAVEQVCHTVICDPATRNDDAEVNRPFCGATELRQLTED